MFTILSRDLSGRVTFGKTDRCHNSSLKMQPWLPAFVEIAPDCLKSWSLNWGTSAESWNKLLSTFLENCVSAPASGVHLRAVTEEGRRSHRLCSFCLVGSFYFHCPLSSLWWTGLSHEWGNKLRTNYTKGHIHTVV